MKEISINEVKIMLHSAVRQLEADKDLLDSLNVFPVPDGDTGTNMFMTISTAEHEIKNSDTNEMDQLMHSFAYGALRGAHGNSGVILSQIFKGLSDIFSDYKKITSKIFAQALVRATDVAYAAVKIPKEGTILTVIRYMAEQSKSLAIRYSSVETFLKEVVQKGEEILAKTPEMLPILKQAGVVDAGGRGLISVFTGMLKGLLGEEIVGTKPQEENIPVAEAMNLTADTNDAIINCLGEIKYGYCTEYFVIQIKDTVTEEDISRLRDRLSTIGDSVICIGDLSLIKVHVHTNQPNRALNFALQLGEIDKIKIENMREQNRVIRRKIASTPKKEMALMTICVGEGIKNIFKELGVSQIVEGGQTMNPSVEDILSSIQRINSDNIIIMPNNKNIIMAAQQAKELSEKNIEIIPTINVLQGIKAVLAFDDELTFKDNIKNMNKTYKDIIYGQVTHAVRKTKIDGLSLEEGDIIGLDDKKILTKGSDVDQVVIDLIDALKDEDSEIITLYYGDKVTKEQAEELKKKIENKYKDFEVIVNAGGQPHYFYFLSIE